jgi:hypothetical protein
MRSSEQICEVGLDPSRRIVRSGAMPARTNDPKPNIMRLKLECIRAARRMLSKSAPRAEVMQLGREIFFQNEPNRGSRPALLHVNWREREFDYPSNFSETNPTHRTRRCCRRFFRNEANGQADRCCRIFPKRSQRPDEEGVSRAQRSAPPVLQWTTKREPRCAADPGPSRTEL